MSECGVQQGRSINACACVLLCFRDRYQSEFVGIVVLFCDCCVGRSFRGRYGAAGARYNRLGLGVVFGLWRYTECKIAPGDFVVAALGATDRSRKKVLYRSDA